MSAGGVSDADVDFCPEVVIRGIELTCSIGSVLAEASELLRC